MDGNAVNKLPDGFDHQAFLTIDSTNKEAIRRLQKSDASGLWITASEQTLGRGRLGREWVSKSGNLYCSLILKTDGDIRRSAQLTFVASLAVRDTIAQFINDERVKCKWPNDILVDGKKICGILLESYEDGDGGHYMIIGIGINVVHHPNDTLYETTHINELSDYVYSHVDVFYVLADKMSQWVLNWEIEGFDALRSNWLKNATGVGSTITVRLPKDEIVGRFVDLDSSGALMLQKDDEIILIHSGDVFFAQ